MGIFPKIGVKMKHIWNHHQASFLNPVDLAQHLRCDPETPDMFFFVLAHNFCRQQLGATFDICARLTSVIQLWIEKIG